MPKLLLQLLVLLLVANLSEQIVCPPNACANTQCTIPARCPEHQTLAPTFCGCCKRCVPVIPPGGRCLLLSGSPPTSVCAEGTHCINGICS